MLTDFFAHESCELVVDGVAWTRSNNATFDGASDKGHVADDVKQFVTCALVFPYQWLVLDVAKVVGIAVLNVEHVCQHVKTLLGSLALVDDNSIVQVASLNQVSLQQWLNVTYKDKGAGGGYFCGEVLNLVDSGKLRVDEFRFKRTHSGERELVIGQNGDA